MTYNVIPLRRPASPRAVGRTCICGATWRPGFSSDPAWLITANPELRTFQGVLDCHACGRWKMDVIHQQAEAERAKQPHAIVVQRPERPPATVTQLQPRT